MIRTLKCSAVAICLLLLIVALWFVLPGGEGLPERADPSKQKSDDMAELAQLQRRVSALYATGNYAETETLFKRALKIQERLNGHKHTETAAILYSLAQLYANEFGRYDEAEKLYIRAIEIQEALGLSKHPFTANCLRNLGVVYKRLGRYSEAERPLKSALVGFESLDGPESVNVGQVLTDLAGLYVDQGRYSEADLPYKRVIAINEKLLGPEHPATGKSLGNLAGHYTALGRNSEGEALFKRAIAIFERALGPEHPDTANALIGLGQAYSSQGRYAEAELLVKQALMVFEKVFGSDHQLTVYGLGSLAEMKLTLGDHGEAEALYKRALMAREKVLGPDHRYTASSLMDLAEVYARQSRYDEAEPLVRRALAIAEASAKPQIGWWQSTLSTVLLALGRPEEAYAASIRATQILSEEKSKQERHELHGAMRIEASSDGVFLQKVRAAHTLSRLKPNRNAALRAESLEAAQWVGLGPTTRAVAQMASRFAAGNDGLTNLLREQQAALLRASALDKLLSEAMVSTDSGIRARADLLRRQGDAVGARLQEIDATLRRNHAAYADLVDPKPVSAADAQALLSEDEAIVLILVGRDETFLFAVTDKEVHWAKAEMTERELSTAVRRLRVSLDPKQLRRGDFDVKLEPFDRQLAFALYQKIWAPLEVVLTSKSQVFVIPTGPLTSLPLSILVTEKPAGGVRGDADAQSLRDTDWLIKRHALTTLPSVSSLRALRRYGSREVADEPFAGFGDPILGQTSLKATAIRGIRGNVSSFFRGNEPNQLELASLGPVKYSSDELETMARILGASPTRDIWLRERATEAQVKQIDLSRKQVIAFATHGLMAGDTGFGEPGLVLTLPKTPNVVDDGYFAASEVSTLKLRADWIILSACNTAAGDKPVSEGLSGLARAFFLAGARSLLVSHWQVWNDAAMNLTTTTVMHFRDNPSQGRAQALRKASLALMQDTSHPRYAHPAIWAPFVLVGETTTRATSGARAKAD